MPNFNRFPALFAKKIAHRHEIISSEEDFEELYYLEQFQYMACNCSFEDCVNLYKGLALDIEDETVLEGLRMIYDLTLPYMRGVLVDQLTGMVEDGDTKAAATLHEVFRDLANPNSVDGEGERALGKFVVQLTQEGPAE